MHRSMPRWRNTLTTQIFKTTTLRARDLSCPSCVNKIETALNRMDGVENSEVMFNTGRIVVRHDPSRVRASDLVKKVAQAGFVAEPSAF